MRKGFSLVEIMIVIAILAIMMVIMVMTINPIAMIQRGTDARMKKDLSRIRVAFEEYRNDKKTFPNNSAPDFLVNKLMDRANCGTGIFAPWLNSWPCDPHGNPYKIMVEENSFPQWFKVLTKLDNKKDADIPAGREDKTYNYGVSSTNVLWYDLAGCKRTLGGSGDQEGVPQCYIKRGLGCGHVAVGCLGESCYADDACSPFCQTDCCGGGGDNNGDGEPDGCN
ncbi:MAG: prepilin-type N-terminal cleavage/methylation domain-containing protein [Candidatus Shapirobacteria bacterium]|jgi:prepilin-type N-terminal cleavage/methylation domain-containing protein